MCGSMIDPSIIGMRRIVRRPINPELPMFSLPDAIIIASLIIATALVLSTWIYARHGASKPAPFSPMFPPLPPLPPEAYPVEPSGIPVRSETPLEVGDSILANSEGVWYRAKVLDLESDGRVRI